MFIDHVLPNSLSQAPEERDVFTRFTETSAYFAPSELGFSVLVAVSINIRLLRS
jgi:hypothetical protein